MTYCGAVQTWLGAERLECVQLAGAFAECGRSQSGSKLHALQTLCVTGTPLLLYVSVFRAAHVTERTGCGSLLGWSAGADVGGDCLQSVSGVKPQVLICVEKARLEMWGGLSCRRTKTSSRQAQEHDEELPEVSHGDINS